MFSITGGLHPCCTAVVFHVQHYMRFTQLDTPEPAVNLHNANDYYLPLPRTEAFKKSIAYSLPFTWDELQPEIKYQENAITFKWALKAHLLESIMEE